MSQDNFSSPNNQQPAQPQQVPVYYPQQLPEKKSKPWLWALGGGCAGMALLFAGCSALVIGAAASSSSSKASASASVTAVAVPSKMATNAEQQPTAVQQAPTQTTKTAPATHYQVELRATVNGKANVMYGNLGSTSTETITEDWSSTLQVPRREYYSFSVYNSFGFSGDEATEVSCTILVNGEVVDHKEAKGDYARAHCSLSSSYRPKS